MVRMFREPSSDSNVLAWDFPSTLILQPGHRMYTMAGSSAGHEGNATKKRLLHPAAARVESSMVERRRDHGYIDRQARTGLEHLDLLRGSGRKQVGRLEDECVEGQASE